MARAAVRMAGAIRWTTATSQRLVDATPEQALEAVVGYSTFNDLTARRAQKTTSQWIRGKNADRSGPLGPMVPAAEVGDLRDGLRVRTRVNGTTVQDDTTHAMVCTVGYTQAHTSRTFTDDVEVDRLGVLRSVIVDAEERKI